MKPIFDRHQDGEVRRYSWVGWAGLSLLILIGMLPVVFPLTLFQIGAVIGGLLLLGAACTWPEVFLVLGIGTNFLKTVYIPGLSFGKYGVALFMLFTALAAVGYLYQLMIGKRNLILPPALFYLTIFWIGTSLSYLLVAEIRMTLGIFARTVLGWVVFFLMIQFLTTRRALQGMLDALLVQAGVVISWGILTGIRMNYFGVPKHRLFFWNQVQKNDYAIYLSFVLVLALAVIASLRGQRKSLRKTTAFFLVLAVPVAWLFTYSRSGFLAIFSAGLAFLILDQRKKLLRLLVRWGLPLFLVVVIFFLAFSSEARDLAVDGFRAMINPEAARFERNVSNIQKRIDLLRVGLEVVSQHPLTGVDYSQWLQYSPQEAGHFDPQLGERIIVGQSVHNRFLSIAVRSGLVTLFGYLGFVITAFGLGYRLRKGAGNWYYTHVNALLAALIGFQIGLFFIPSFVWEWVIFGLLFAFLNLLERDPEVASAQPGRFRYFRFQNHAQ